jgi:hypothetical protein
MRRVIQGGGVVVACAVGLVVASGLSARADGRADDESRIRRGLAISPVPVHVTPQNRALVGLGSYLVNAAGSCQDCHSCPTYAPGHNPYDGVGDGQANAANYLAGGVPFGPPGGLVSANLTPDPVTGRPGGMTPAEFVSAIRTGHDPEEPGRVLQVMPWPVLRNLTDADLRAIYAYLSAIPHAEPGACGFPGQ